MVAVDLSLLPVSLHPTQEVKQNLKEVNLVAEPNLQACLKFEK